MRTAVPSLCESCTFMRVTHGRLGRRYVLCRNERIPAKYLPQPVVTCEGYAPVRPSPSPEERKAP